VLALVALEALLLRWRRMPGYDWRESAVSAFIALGQRLALVAAGLLLWPAYQWVYAHRAFTVDLHSAAGLLALFIGVEFFYYWEHRLSHRVRWLWATHAVHHSPARLNLSAAYRIGWTSLLSGIPLFLMPMMALGFAPQAVLAMMGLNLLYQFWLHTELVPPLGLLDRVFNTPANHRVHHGSNDEYLDRNFGGVLMVFDHLFGTWQRELPGIAPRYGLAGASAGAGPDYHPLRVALGEWRRLVAAWCAAGSPMRRWRVLLGPP
jgi:sterol desaturase/sphingolipid hydroxylase (fatty acid hydroxylase superfamily)